MTDLGISYGTLRREVGRFLGFDRTPANWGSNETQDVQDVVDAGLRQFYRPPRLNEERHAHQWSFLRPFGYLTLKPNEWDYDMPEDFAGLDGPLYFLESDFVARAIQVVGEGKIQQLRQRYWFTPAQCDPEYAAITPKRSNGISQSVYQLLLWPKPDQAYTLQFKYLARQTALRSDDDVPLGASEHAEAILASCMAVAEAHLDDEIGPKWQRFMDQLRSSVDFDRRASGPVNLGKLDDPGSACGCEGMYARAIGGLVTHAALEPADPGDPGSGDGIVSQEGETLVTQEGEQVVSQ